MRGIIPAAVTIELVFDGPADLMARLDQAPAVAEQITRDRVLVTPAAGVPGKMPFWHGDGAGRRARDDNDERRPIEGAARHVIRFMVGPAPGDEVRAIDGGVQDDGATLKGRT